MYSLVDRVIVLVCQVDLGLLFSISAFSKVTALDEFVEVVRNYLILPRSMVLPIAYSVPLLEASIAGAILFPPTRLYASFGAVILIVMFTVAMAITLMRGRYQIDCGCFGPWLKQSITWAMVFRNGVLALMAIMCMKAAPATGPMHTLNLFTGIGGGIGMVLLYLSLTTLLSLRGVYGQNLTRTKGP
jgi:hypothetical protein